MVVVPIGALTLLGVRLVHQQGEIAQHQVSALLEDRLREVDGSVRRFIEERERELARVARTLPVEVDATRDALAALDRPVDLLVFDSVGALQHPRDEIPTPNEAALLERTRTLRRSGALWEEVARARDAPSTERAASRRHGWFGYEHGGSWYLLAWFDLAGAPCVPVVPIPTERRWGRTAGPPACGGFNDRVVVIEVPQITLLSDLVAFLPETSTGDESRSPSRTTLLDATDTPVYHWGSYEPPPSEGPRASYPLGPPLEAWSLQHYSPESALPTFATGAVFSLGLGLLAVALALVALAVYLYRMRTSEMRVAAQRVSFVNQVSHELKTPLTNIRLYAELLADELGLDGVDDDVDPEDPAARHLSVITSESQRLSRLITNVLTFARGQEGRLSVNPRPRALDDVVRATRATFGPSLERADVAVHLDLAAPELVLVDADAVEQILANLLNNVEKYARDGRGVWISTARVGDRAIVRVADRGPGIPEGQRDRVFEPFHRLSDRLSDGVSGTGIGLDIARQLARLHGGDLRVVDSEVGACFELSLHTPPAATHHPHRGAP